MKIYTKTGDTGSTALFGGGRVSKTHPRITAYGTVDETNAVLGVARASLKDQAGADRLTEVLSQLQHDLFVLGGDLATPGEVSYPVPRIEASHTVRLEDWIDAFDAELNPLKNFILPGGSLASAHLQVARTVCRRAERAVLDAQATEAISAEAVRYLNRLSDLLFVLARWANHSAGEPEILWDPVG